MDVSFWEGLPARDFVPPDDASIDDLTVELVHLLGSPDPHLRDDIACTTLATWIERGRYDDLLAGLGDGIAAGLGTGLGEAGTDTVFRRSFSALLLGVIIDRATTASLLEPERLLGWFDALVDWLVRERDLRDFVPGKGWAHALAHGADALAAVARSPQLQEPELAVLLDVVAERLEVPGQSILSASEDDRFSLAVLAMLERDRLGLDVIELWLQRVSAAALAQDPGDGDRWVAAANAQRFLRSLHLRLVLGEPKPSLRSDVLLLLVDRLRETNPWFLGHPDAADL